MAFLGAGLHDLLWPALVVDALGRARRSVAMYRERSEPVDDWLAGEVRLRGIRENAAVLAVLEVPQWRDQAAELYRGRYPERTRVLSALLDVLDPRPVGE
jgi:hypothetical protein